MKKMPLIVAAATTLVLALAGCKTDTNTVPPAENPISSELPYNIQLVELTNPNLPNLHSFTYGIYNDKIVMFGGRRKGLHASDYAFSQSSANKIIYVVDTHTWGAVSTWSVYSRADSLTVPVGNINCAVNAYAGQFRANNAEFFTNGNTLYVIGGLIDAAGTSTANAGGVFTIPYMTAVDMGPLVTAVMNGTTIAAGAVRQVENPKLALTGGEIANTGNTVTLAFGWNFAVNNNGNYSHLVSTLTYTDNTSLAITINAPCPTCWDGADSVNNEGYFRRRDGSMSTIIDPATGNPNLMYYAGVFKNGNTNFTTPVWMRNDSAIEYTNFDMRANVYTCKVLPFYSKSRKESYATMLGGMTNSTYSSESYSVNTLLSNSNSTITTLDTNNFLNVPFFNGISTIKIDQNRNFSQYMMAAGFPTTAVNMALPTYTTSKYPASYTLQAGANAYNGAEAELFLNYNQAYNYQQSGVIDIDSLVNNNPSGLQIGYLFGGILSVIDNVNINNGANNQERLTVASNRIFAITIVPTTGSANNAAK